MDTARRAYPGMGETVGADSDPTRIAAIEPSTFATRAGGNAKRAGSYAQLSRQIRAAGLLGRRRGHYLSRIGLTVGLWVTGWAVFAWVGSSWWQLVVAGLLAVVFAQIGFLGHDAGHRQIFRSRRANDVVGLLFANGLIGLSYSWWITKHNRHHAHPNQIGADPDIAGAGIAFTPAQAEARRGGVGRWVARHQAGLFFPMLLLEGLDLHFSSVRSLVERRAVRSRAWWVESVLLAGHLGGYLTAVFWVLPIGQATAFVAVHQGLLGLYLGCSFAPGHKGAPQLAAGAQVDFLRRQVITTRNITGGRWLEWAMGGLNFQIEHHLFPTMPSPNLRHARPLIRAFCDTHELPYDEATLPGCYAQVLRYLHRVGAAAEPRTTALKKER